MGKGDKRVRRKTGEGEKRQRGEMGKGKMGEGGSSDDYGSLSRGAHFV